MSKNYTLKIMYDEDAFSPREDDNLGTMVCYHDRYDLGDKHTMEKEDLLHLVEGHSVIALPLYLYDHSGITIRTCPFSCSWDSGLIGYIYVSLEKVREEFGCTRVGKKIRERVVQCLMTEVSTYDMFIMGECYCFELLDSTDTVVESVGGFIGYDIECNGISDYVDMAEIKEVIRD